MKNKDSRDSKLTIPQLFYCILLLSTIPVMVEVL